MISGAGWNLPAPRIRGKMTDKTSPPDVLGQLGALRRYALTLTRNRDDAEDLVHDTLVRAIERQHQFRPGLSLRPWLLSILHNGFVDKLRARRAEARRNAEIVHGETAELAPSQDHALRLAEVRRAFLTLPEEQRAALHLVSIEGLSYEEAAASLGIPMGTLVSRVSRARARLREIENGEGVARDNVVPFKAAGGSDGP